MTLALALATPFVWIAFVQIVHRSRPEAMCRRAVPSAPVAMPSVVGGPSLISSPAAGLNFQEPGRAPQGVRSA